MKNMNSKKNNPHFFTNQRVEYKIQLFHFIRAQVVPWDSLLESGKPVGVRMSQQDRNGKPS